MAGVTLEQAEAMLAEAMLARTEALKSQEMGIKDRRVRRADLEQINADIKYWDGQVKKLSSGRTGARVRGVTVY